MRAAPLLFLAFVAPALATTQERIPVLIVSGANNHDWEWTTSSLERILLASGKFAPTVTYDPEATFADADGIARYAAFVLDYNRGEPWSEPAAKNFLDAVRGGTGVTVVHAANNAFPGWVEYEKLVGDLWRAGTGHGRFHAFDVRVTRRDHPITATLPDLVQHPDELYHKLVRMHDARHETLAVAHSSTESGGTGADEPMILVATYGEGRVFHTPLGHVWSGQEATKASHHDPQFHNVIVRGTEWAATGRVTDGLAAPNRLSAEEARAGWRLLFDGETTRGWRGFKKPGFPDTGWEVVNGCLRHTQGGGDIVTTETFQHFELAFEWKVARGVNSGVKVRVPERESGGAVGPEYQLLDDSGTDESKNPLSSAGALYAMVAPAAKELALPGAFNHSRIVCRGVRHEHWLNGKKIVDIELGSADWEAAKAASKFRNVEDFGQTPGHVLLQDHGGDVWFRSIRIRDLTPQGESESLLSGDGLAGWTAIGGATYAREGDTIVGSVGDGLGSNAFLRTDRTYSDFVFDVDLKVEETGNSGIQFRSHVHEKGHVFGYQAEIDCSQRAWSGGIYDESRRGWLCNLDDNPAGKAAFRVDDWNHFRIEARGTRLRVWVNGVQTAELEDDADSEGFLALQVHGGKTGTFRWRDPRIRVLR